MDWKLALTRASFIVPAIVLAGATSEARAQQQPPPAPTSKLEHASRLAANGVKKSKALSQLFQGKSPAEITALSQQKSHAGLKRLSAEDLVAWNRLRLALAERSPMLCAGLWSGKAVGSAVNEALEQLEQAQVDEFISISLRATVAEVEDRPFTPPSQESFNAGLRNIRSGLSPAEVDRMDRVLAKGVDAPAEEACWTMKTILRDSARLSPPEQERFLQYLASL